MPCLFMSGGNVLLLGRLQCSSNHGYNSHWEHKNNLQYRVCRCSQTVELPLLPLFFASCFTQNSIVGVPLFAELLSERDHSCELPEVSSAFTFCLLITARDSIVSSTHGQTLPNTLIPSHFAPSVLLRSEVPRAQSLSGSDCDPLTRMAQLDS